MKKFFCVFAFLAVGCSSTQKINALRPEPDDGSPLVYETAVSYLNVPVSIKLKDIETQTNKLMSGLIYEDSRIEDDDIAMKVWKLAPISIRNENGKIRTVLPLRAEIRYRIGTNKLGVNLYDTRTFNLSGKVSLLSDVALTNWQLNTRTKLTSLDWNESPTMDVMGRQVAITYLVNPAIRFFQSRIERSIDQAIAESMDFKPNVLDALRQLSAPLQMSETYQSWLRIVPIELYATDAAIAKDAVNLGMGLKCHMETRIGPQPENGFDRSKIVLKPIVKIPDNLQANIVAVSTYDDASKVMTKNFSGQEFASGSRKVTVQKVGIWQKDNKMVIALDLNGSVNGTIYLTGFPQYNTQTQEIYFDKLDYAIDTKSALMRTANWLAQGYILKKMQESCRYSIKPNIEEARKNMAPYLDHYAPMPGVFIDGSIKNIAFQKIQLSGKAIVAFIKVDGTLSVSVDGLK
jgi:hypothetical protein